MKTRSPLSVIPWGIPLLLLLSMPLAPSVHALEAGAAKLEITPELGTPLHGYGMRQGRGAAAVHDTLWARSLYLDDGETQVFLVNIDLLLISSELRARVLELAPGQIASEHIILTATHTHNGPGGIHQELPFRMISGRYMPEVIDALAYRIAESMRMAYEARTRAAIGYGEANNAELSVNRADPEGPVDDSIGVIRVDDVDGNPIAIAGILAAHPTLTPTSHRYAFSADYPGFYYDALEEMTADGCIALFFNGALGNQGPGNPEEDPEDSWRRLESVGELLALQVKGASNDILCGEAGINVGYMEARLPTSLAPDLFAREVVLQTLEIDDLLLTFFPGEPTVEIGLELRRRALARGYENQYVVGLANDALLYFVSWEQYAEASYENSLHFYGPHMEDWFYEQFGFMMQKPPAAGETTATPDSGAGEDPETYLPETAAMPGGTYVKLTGDPTFRGRQMGLLLGEMLNTKYDAYIQTPLANHALTPESGIWDMLPGFVNPSPLALPTLAYAVRPHLALISTDLRREMEGMAASADLHFDKLWLLQHVGHLPYVDDQEALFKLPFCTMMAVTGERAEGADLLVARNLDWPLEEEGYVVEVQPDQGRRYLQVGFGWNSGVYTGMNDAGLVLSMERLALDKYAVENQVALELLLRDILSTHSNVAEARAALEAIAPIPGYQILLAGYSEEGPEALVLSYEETAQVRGPEDGVLLGVDPRSPVLNAATRMRYERAATLLQAREQFSVGALQEILLDEEPGKDLDQRIWNPHTRHSVVFHPQRREVHVAFPDGAGNRGEYTTFSLEGE